MASTAGARHLAESKIFMAYQAPPEVPVAHDRAPLVEIAIQHMDDAKAVAFLLWLEDALESE